MEMENLTTVIGLCSALLLLLMLLWSIAVPGKRLWPPNRSTRVSQVIVWALTIAIFASALVLGLIDWNRFQWPAWMRWGLGAPLIVVGNWVAWRGAFDLGIKATSGAVDTLKTSGLYRYSRNPQYIADIGILVGWAVLSGSQTVLPVASAGVLVLLVAPLAEEPWLRKIYGQRFEEYCKHTRRYL